jgi:hypothetical protein
MDFQVLEVINFRIALLSCLDVETILRGPSTMRAITKINRSSGMPIFKMFIYIISKRNPKLVLVNYFSSV